MIPATVNIEFVRGDTFSRFGRVRTKVWDSVTSSYVVGPYRDLTGWSGLAQVRASQDDTQVLWVFSINLGNQITVPGSFFIESSAANTVNQTVLTGVWDLQWTTDIGETYTYCEGTVKLRKDVSRV